MSFSFRDSLSRAISGFFRTSQNHVIIEDPDSLGYVAKKPGPFMGATRETKNILLSILPEDEWDEMRENATTDFIVKGAYDYTKDTA